MLIYLDSKDLINIFEKAKPLSAVQFENFLKGAKHKIVLSFLTIMELAEPLLDKKATTNVTDLLNHLEKLPHTYIHSDISCLELQEALRAFSAGDNYKSIFPFVNRFDETVDLNASPPTKIYINYSLSETVWDLYCFGALGGLDKYADKLRQTFAADRALSPKPSLKKHFTKTIERNIRLDRLTIPPENISAFADWIYSDASRCPSGRLGYELWHKMVRNITDIPHDSDLEDFHHIECLPYVDLMTLDRRMHGYVGQVSKDMSVDYDKRIFRSTKEVLNKIGLI
jgi:hypothetical protein